ncbi:flagellar hook-associated protein FlgK [Poseidonibacter lekithochrous]|uniref:flagellar hook-associated protein FlgK n=1 Tax=Poseidonibacter lekithochrous TaxID=1904463 RepID=UPI0008FCCA8F|nr:flagellar basal body rod C-terminal domain-containing protein [Poseidonibacter lekithochrous]QKJ24352.1 proximal flagellar hook-filament junction protein [Poseidonibacter lekithochrous]
MLNTLNVSYSGLTSAKIAVENVSNNIANENTPGYKKRVVDMKELEQTDTRFTGRGVGSDNAYRITSQYMFDRLLSESSRQSNFSKTSSILANVEVAFKETENSGFSSDLNRYFQAVENLRSNPNSEIYKNSLANEGKVIVSSLQSLYSSIEKTQALEKEELQSNVTKVNSLLQEIGGINEKLGKQSVATNDLLDKRDQLEEELSGYVDIEVSRENNEYELKIAGNVAVRYNTNVRDVKVVESKEPQVDRFVDSTGIASNTNFKDGVASAGDEITFKLNNNTSVTVTIGSNQYTDTDGNTHDIDIDGDGNPDTVTASNYVRALAYSINENPSTKGLVTAYNGNYVETASGKVDNKAIDKFLVIESDESGLDGKFESRITVKETIAGVEERSNTYKDENQSSDAVDKVAIAIYDQEISLKSGTLKAQTDSLTSNSPNNKLQVYKDKLDAFARTFADVTDQYIKTGTDQYTYGELAADETNGTITSLNLFSGTSVKTMTFNEAAINDLDQKDLDYLATLQWKKDLSFDGKAQDPSNNENTSFSEFFQEIRVNVSSDKESSDFLHKTQKDVQTALTSSYNELVKVDKDEELLNLVKFQAAYEANAKIITVIDEMLKTLLGLKR